VALAEFPEPVILQGNGERRLETNDGENSSGDVGEVAVEAMQERNLGFAIAFPQAGADERKRGEKDEKQVTGQEHQMPLDDTDSVLMHGDFSSLTWVNGRISRKE
jgi:hypothetical protein